MKILLITIGWFLLLVLSWPMAILALVLWPFIWLILLPLRFLGIAVDGVFALIKAVVMLPSRLLSRQQATTK